MDHSAIPTQAVLAGCPEIPTSSELKLHDSASFNHLRDSGDSRRSDGGRIDATGSVAICGLSPPLHADGSSPQSRRGQHSKQELTSGFSRWTSEWISDWWGMELACCVIAALSLIAIVIVLEIHRNKPLPQWYFDITPNSLIAILASVGQMSMMMPVAACISQLKWLWFFKKRQLGGFQAFDDASRGSMGSVVLLFGKCRGIHLASLGAVITIASAAFGPFAQQVVTYPVRLHRTGNAAYAPQVFNYTVAITNQVSVVGPAVIASVYEGLARGKLNLSSVSTSCSTGNCTWAEYSSLGLCASISDLSSAVIHDNCNATALEDILESSGISHTAGYPCFNYTLPGVAFDNTPSSTLVSISNASLSNASPPNLSHGFPGILDVMSMSLTTVFTNSSSLTTSYLIYQPGVLTSINASLPSPVAYGLNLNLCIQTYDTTVSDSVTSTTLLSSQNLPTEIQWGWNETTQGDTYDGNDTYVSVGGEVFGIDLRSLATLADELGVIFTSGCYQSIPVKVDEGLINETAPGGYGCDADVLDSLFDILLNSTDPLPSLTDFWDNVAISMTNAFRTTSGGNTGAGGDTSVGQFQGTTFTPVAFIESNYLWLILPISLVSMTLVFLLATIIQSQRYGSKIWKSSNLATMQGLDIELHRRLGGLSTATEMEEKTKNIEIMLNKKSVEYRLVESKQQAYWRG